MKQIFYIELDEDYVPIFKVCGITAPFSEFKEQIICKDCKHRNDLELFGRTYHLCERFGHQIDDLDNYCSWAVRRDKKNVHN